MIALLSLVSSGTAIGVVQHNCVIIAMELCICALYVLRHQ